MESNIDVDSDGLHVADDEEVERVHLGQISSGRYGLRVSDGGLGDGSNTTVDADGVRVEDSSGAERVRLGKLGGSGDFGLRVNNPGGTVIIDGNSDMFPDRVHRHAEPRLAVGQRSRNLQRHAKRARQRLYHAAGLDSRPPPGRCRRDGARSAGAYRLLWGNPATAAFAIIDLDSGTPRVKLRCVNYGASDLSFNTAPARFFVLEQEAI
jgi:hypothetical protein